MFASPSKNYMKKNLIKIVVGILLLIGGWKIAEKGDNVISKEDLQKLKVLSENAGTATGYVRDSFTETIITIKKLRRKCMNLHTIIR